MGTKQKRRRRRVPSDGSACDRGASTKAGSMASRSAATCNISASRAWSSCPRPRLSSPISRNLDEARRAADRARSYAASPVGGGSGEPLWLLPLPCCCERRLRRFSTALPRSRITVGRSPVSEAAAGEAATRRRLDGEAELMRATQQQQQQTKGDEDDEERQEQHRSVVNGCPVVYGYVGYGAARYGLDHRKFRRLSSPPLC